MTTDVRTFAELKDWAAKFPNQTSVHKHRGAFEEFCRDFQEISFCVPCRDASEDRAVAEEAVSIQMKHALKRYFGSESVAIEWWVPLEVDVFDLERVGWVMVKANCLVHCRHAEKVAA